MFGLARGDIGRSIKQACAPKGGHELASNPKAIFVVRDSGDSGGFCYGEAVVEVVLQHPT